MQIKFNDKSQLECITINGLMKYFQGFNRSVLEFHFSPNVITFEQLDSLFENELKTKKIIFITSDGEFLNENYTLRMELKYCPIILEPATSTTPEIIEQRLVATMAQKTYSELQQEALQDTIDILVLESLGV